MKQSINILRGRPWLIMLLAALIAWLQPQDVVAANRSVNMTYNYQVMLSGSNTIRIKAPVYDEDLDDHWVRNGYLKAKWKDKSNVEHTATVLYWGFNYKSSNGPAGQESAHDNDDSTLPVFFQTEIDGSFIITQGNTSKQFTLTKEDGKVTKTLYENSNETYDFEATWRLPYDMLGCDITFSWDVKVDYTNGKVWSTEYAITGLDNSTIAIPPAAAVVQPQVTMAILSNNEVGKIEVPWFMASDDITAARYEYLDHNGNKVSKNLTYNKNGTSIMLDATVPHNSFRVIVSYKDAQGNPVNNISSEVQDLKMVHIPVGLTAKPLGNNKAAVQLDWTIMHPTVEDVSSYDAFEIQRSLTGKEEDFETIFSEPYIYDPKESTYSFIDSTLVEAIVKQHLKNGGTLDSLTYRVRRSMTESWGWNHYCAPSARCVVEDIHLLRIATYSAKWEDQRAFSARVSWEYPNEYNMVWDDRAKLMMRVTMLNQAGDTVGTKEYTLNAQERQQRYKVIDLSHTCVNYNIEMYVDRGTSQIPLWDEITPYWFPIRTEADWNAFRQKVIDAKGKYDVNARLYTDITTTNSCGAESYPYRGVFDGNGHTLTININYNTEYQSPFRYVGNATIKNLHTAGTVQTTAQYAGGLIGYVVNGSDVTIENCHSSVTINSTKTTNGGFIARLGDNGKALIRNSKFDGSFEGAESHHNGGFIGYCQDKSTATIDNCIFAPDHITTDMTNCETWARGGGHTLSVINSHATREYSAFIAIRNVNDWNTFRDMVEAAKGNYWVDARLETDITVNNYVGGGNAAPYRGTFDGNGHTLNVNINNNVSCRAPFSYVGDVTIKNLHVTGTVRGALHAAGLIGGVWPRTSSVTVDRVWVSTGVTSSSTHAAGVFGHCAAANVYMNDVRFDGKVVTHNQDGNYAGCIIGWGGEGSWTFHRVYNASKNADFTAWRIWFCVDSGSGTAEAWGSNSRSSNTITSTTWDDWGVTAYNKTDQTEVMNLMNGESPDSWQLVNGQAVPVLTTTDATSSEEAFLSKLGNTWTMEGGKLVPVTTHFVDPSTVYPEPQLPNFYHEGNGVIDQTLMTEMRQSSVVITWNVDGIVDYFQVYRRIAGSGDDAWQLIVDNIDQMGYEDKDVSPLEDYEYKVRAVTDCEGLHYSETQVKQGNCKHTGRVSGYVRFNDGTGVPDIMVTVKHDKEAGNESDKTYTAEVFTDETGYFVADGLPYNGLPSIEYAVYVTSDDAVKFEPGKERTSVTFNSESNEETTSEFTIINSHRFSGYVMYDGTSIPVKGAHFKVDEHNIYTASGKLLETAYDGSFSFRVLDGQRKIQAWMDKHVFTGKGYYLDKDKNKIVNINEDKASIYFYDSTMVKLVGRIVGGVDQGNKPLDNNLSMNNLGRNLTMVMTLEGDNSSWLVYDNLNPEKKSRELTFPHAQGNGHKTTAVVERKRMIVKPDSITGEYTLMLPPVRWKVQQLYCENFSTLFQEGQVSEVVDLTECLVPLDTTYVGTFTDVDKNSIYQPKATYNAIYNRIYHTPIEITYKQVGYDSFDYFGDKIYAASTAGGIRVDVPLAYEKNGATHYTFGYPVFSLNRHYPIAISVVERYPWNSIENALKDDMVRIGGGKVTVHNGMKNSLTSETVELDSLGQGYYLLAAEETVRLLTGDDALKTVTMTLEQDGTSYEAEPLKGYTLNTFAIGQSKDVLVGGRPMLVDILRDPPGGGSSATLSKGSTLKYNYTLDMTMKVGPELSFGTGTELENFQGTVVSPPVGSGVTYGIVNESNVENWFTKAITYDVEGHRAFSYTIDVNQDITTSSDQNMVGADADLYIGTVQNFVVTPMSTIRAIPDSIYQHMQGRLGGGTTAGVSNQYGTLVEIAQGHDADNNLYHLVRDESIGYGPKVQSQFVHSQKHILTELLPAKVQELRALMYTGTKGEAQTQANATGKPVYLSKVPADDEEFGVEYEWILPSGTTEKDFTDEANEMQDIILAWLNLIALNEKEKLSAWDKLANYDVDGGTAVSYSEAFESEYSISNYAYFPGIKSDGYFENNAGRDGGFGLMSAILVPVIKGLLQKFVWSALSDKASGSQGQAGGKENKYGTAVNFMGRTYKFSVLPVFDYSVKGVGGESKAYSRKESFNIVMDKKSHLNFDVYRVRTDTASVKTIGDYDVFTNQNFTGMTNYIEPFLKRHLDLQNALYPRSFVYRTNGGATVNPWESERKTIVYESGRLLDERTKKIQNPKITLDRQSVSGVALDKPARFKVYLTNDSEQPEVATGSISMYKFYLNPKSNPNGAKVMVDGIALTSEGWDLYLNPGEVVERTLEVYAGTEFDYEGLKIGLISHSDPDHICEEVAFDVHYLHQAGPVNISSPGDKWVMNTYASEDTKRGWFIPVTIDGFDRHQHNFDHIEFQYKESQRGDDSWTNLCSFYADSLLMAQASGERELIPENGNIVTNFYGEGVVMEKAYDLRAVLYCRNGNSFLTTPSKIISGVKDTRRPQLFGTPEPVNGILKTGDNIVFNFSEDIEYNYLSAITNFEVKGETNNDHISENVSVQFTGKASMETEAMRNFSGKDLTIDLMIKPDTLAKRDMPLFSHGSNGHKLQLWLTKDFNLKAVINNNEYVSDSIIKKNIFTQVAMCIDQNDDSLRLFNGGKLIGRFPIVEHYNGTGNLVFGRTNESDRSVSKYYEGRMMEARLWYRAMDGGLIGSTYGGRRLTGTELGLVDYYPMNEGTGDHALDKTQGAHAKLIGTNWAMPRGYSLRLENEDHGIKLTKNALNRTKEQDYTLMFWFKTDSNGRGVLVSNGGGTKDEIGAKNIFNIAFEGKKLMYRSNGLAIEVPGDWSNNEWHHFAMTMNRGLNVANIYVDQVLRSTFDTDSIGGISGGHPLIGAALFDTYDANGHVATIDTRNWLTGYIDELCFFAQALPETLIKTYSMKSPSGDEAGLMTYLSFDRQERQKNNEIVMVPYEYSKKIYLDADGNIRYQLDPQTLTPTTTPMRDYVFVDSAHVIRQHISEVTAAPVVPFEELENLKFSFVGEGHKLLVNLNEKNAKLNRRNIYVTIRDVEDKNGNTMASPQTACYLVNNSSLQWVVNRYDYTTMYGAGETGELVFYNNSATSHTYTIENCPKWLTLNKYSDVIAPQNMEYINATINKDLNVGTYNEILYLTDEEGITEPFYLNLTVEDEQPEWANSINSDLLKYSMSISGQVYLYDELDTDARDIVGVFDNENVCHGFANISHNVQTGETGLYLTVYDNQTSGRALHFRLWQYSTGREIVLTTKPAIKFTKDAILGTDKPVRFDGGEGFVQYFNLKSGWNWISFNVASEQLFNLNTLLDGLPWKEGDVLTDLNSDATLVFRSGHWLVSGDANVSMLSQKKAYAIMVEEDIQFPIAGTVIKQADMRTIELKQGWNGIGYTPTLNLSVETALSDYYDKAEPGDVIKSHDEFAYFSKSGGVGRWRGNLQYMKPGEGYMLLRKAAGTTTFTYPYYEPGSTFLDEWAYNGNTRTAAPARAKSTMSVSAVVDGFALEDGDKLIAFSDGEVVGSEEFISERNDKAERATAQPHFYISIAGDEEAGIWFAIERDGEIVAATNEQMTFSANAVIGTPDEPTAISFNRNDREDGKWHTIDGLLLQKKPTLKGVYIFNGKKVVIK